MNDHSDGFYCCAECHSDMRFVNQHARDHEAFYATLTKER